MFSKYNLCCQRKRERETNKQAEGSTFLNSCPCLNLLKIFAPNSKDTVSLCVNSKLSQLCQDTFTWIKHINYWLFSVLEQIYQRVALQ